ncbi:MAG: stage II sporulation protein P, partial [Clostridia bacterium]|nr:stage II sporulation protein P [Clostridia bacterium]
MSNNDLIPIENNRPYKKKTKKHILLKLICYALILLLGYYAYLNLDNIKAYFDEHKMPSQNEQSNDKEPANTEKPQGGSTENNDNKVENTVNIPKDAYIINSVTGLFSEINNESSIEIEADLSNETIPKIGDTYEKYGKDAPHILIIHSNCNEAYSNGRYYFTSDSFYSSKSNVGDVGKIICDTLNENHINAIHIDDIFGSGGIFHSRKELESAINEALKKYPSIKIVLDVSRGININDDLSMDKMVAEANEKNAAQISITVGSDNESG